MRANVVVFVYRYPQQAYKFGHIFKYDSDRFKFTQAARATFGEPTETRVIRDYDLLQDVEGLRLHPSHAPRG